MTNDGCSNCDRQKELFAAFADGNDHECTCAKKDYGKEKCSLCRHLVETIFYTVKTCAKHELTLQPQTETTIFSIIRANILRKFGGMSQMLSQRVRNLEQSITLAITARAKEMKSSGEHVVIMASGEPDFDTPMHIKEAAVAAINAGFTKYTATSGIPELKELIAEKLRRENSYPCATSQVIVTTGGKQALFNVFQAILDPGDEVIVIAPYWVSYLEQIKLAGGEPVLLRTNAGLFTPNEFEELITPKTRAVIVNNPSNPSGAIIPEDLCRIIAELAVKHNFYIISDDVYEKFVYDGNKAVSFASFGEEISRQLIIVNAFSKTYSMTGWRIGYCAGPVEIIKAMGLIQDHQSSNVCSISQKAAVAALQGSQVCVEEMISEFDRRRVYMTERLSAIKGIVCPRPQGAFYVFPDVSYLYNEEISDSMTFAKKLLEEEKVAVIPGVGFGYDTHLRLTYSTGMEDIKEGLERFDNFVKRHFA